jgi:ABC-type molybdate transport system permease subunit
VGYDDQPDELSLRSKLATWAAILIVFVGIPVAFFLWMTSVPGESVTVEALRPMIVDLAR